MPLRCCSQMASAFLRRGPACAGFSPPAAAAAAAAPDTRLSLRLPVSVSSPCEGPSASRGPPAYPTIVPSVLKNKLFCRVLPHSNCCGGPPLKGPSQLCSSRRAFAVSPLNPHIHRGVLYPRVPQPYVLVVLLRSVPGVGTAGEVRYVRRGFFRHQLARSGCALPATWQNIDLVHNRMQQLRRTQQQQQQQQVEGHSEAVAEKERERDSRRSFLAVSEMSLSGGAPESDLPADDGGPLFAWLRRLKVQVMAATEETDDCQLTEPLTPQQLLQKLREEEGLDLLEGQLRLLRRRLPPSSRMHTQQQAEWTDELLQGAPLGPITRIGEYDIVVLLPTKARPLARTFTLEIISKTELQRRLEKDRREDLENEAQRTFTLPSLQ